MRTGILINGHYTVIYKKDLAIGDVLTPFLPRLPYMSYTALLHLLRTSRSLLRELDMDRRKSKMIDDMLDYFRGWIGDRQERTMHARLVKAICNIVLGSEGLGQLPEERRNQYDPEEARAIGKITGFAQKSTSGF